MAPHAWLQLLMYTALVLACVPMLGGWTAKVLEGTPTWLSRALGPLERLLLGLAGVRPRDEMGWKRYAWAVLLFNLLGALAVYALLRLQGSLPLNPQGLPSIAPDLAFNTAASFASNTNWQAYAGEAAMSHLSQMAALGVQNFASAATGVAVLAALIRGLSRPSTATLGNFWVDLVRVTLYLLLPLAIGLAAALISQGVVQTLEASAVVTTLEGGQQRLALGPVASQVAIKQLGTNGGGFFNVNSAHPFENPTALSNLLELLAILVIPAALCDTFGRMVKDRRQGLAVLAAMTVVFVAAAAACMVAEHGANPALRGLHVDQSAGMLEGKEVRFGPAQSALWAVATTAASNGSVNSMHDSYSPLGGLVPLWMMQLGEVIFGGVGSGLYGMLMFAVIAVFIAGLMVGRTPEFLGKKIEAFEMKMASLVILIPAAVALVGTALVALVPASARAVANPGPHGFTELLYALSSAANNNGSAFAGLSANQPFLNTVVGVATALGRYWLIVPVLALAGSMAQKRILPPSAGTLPTHTPLFALLLIGTVLLVGALTFIPALALGPLAEHLSLYGGPP